MLSDAEEPDAKQKRLADQMNVDAEAVCVLSIKNRPKGNSVPDFRYFYHTLRTREYQRREHYRCA